MMSCYGWRPTCAVATQESNIRLYAAMVKLPDTLHLKCKALKASGQASASSLSQDRNSSNMEQ